MKRLLIALAVWLAWCATASADLFSVKAMLILATDEGRPMDRRLERVEYQLRRVFKFQYYELLGTAEGSISLPGSVNLDLGHDNNLHIEASGKGARPRAQVVWKRSGEVVLNTTINVTRKNHVVLGGIPYGSGRLIVTLVAD